MIASPLILIATVVLATAAAFVLERRVRWLGHVGASLLAIILGAVLSNTGLVAPRSPVYDAMSGSVTSLAIAWLLLAVRIKDLKDAGPSMLAAYGLAIAGTVLGVATGTLLFAAALGGDAWRLGGTVTGAFSGGALNFVAVSRGLDLPDRFFAGAAAAGNLTLAAWLAVVIAAPTLLGRFWRDPAMGARRRGGDSVAAADSLPHPFFARVRLSTLDFAFLGAVGIALVAAAEWIGGLVDAVPSVVWLSTLSLIAAHLLPAARTVGAMQLGNYALHLFFVVIGIHSRVAEIAAVGPAVFLFILTVVAVHGLVVFGVGRVAGRDGSTLGVASLAAIGGPSTALAVAVAGNRRELILPGIAVGLLGYGLGNYLGIGIGYILRAVLAA